MKKTLLQIAQAKTQSKFQGRTIYFKHLNEIDQIELDDFEASWREEMIDLGMPTRAQALLAAYERGVWTEEQEIRYWGMLKDFEWFYTDKPKFTSIKHIDSFFETVKMMKDELNEFGGERSAALGQTAEEDAQFETYNQEIKVSSFLDPDLKIPFFQEYDEIDPKTMAELHTLYFDKISSLRIDNFKLLKKICCQPFFTSKFCISENPYHFFDKPIWSLTHFQTYLLALGKRFIEVVRHCANAPEEYYEEPDKLECYALMIQDNSGQPETTSSTDLYNKIKKSQITP